jgi:pimeloyl-ACP methyl ester carboxylesterase
MLKDLLDKAGLDTVVLIGGSAGGRLAIDFTLANPGRTRAMVLVGAAITGFSFSEHMWNRGWRNTWGDSTEEMRAFWVNDPWFTAEENPAARARLKLMLTANPQNLENFPVDVLQPESALHRLAQIKVPTLVVIGEADIADNHAAAGILEHQIAGAERAIVLHSGHVPYLEQPEKFDALVFEFLAKHHIGEKS